MTLTYIMVTKHREGYLQMSETLSMPIGWLCLSLTSKFCSPKSPSPKSQTFFYFNLACDVTGDPEVIKIYIPLAVFPGLSNAD